MLSRKNAYQQLFFAGLLFAPILQEGDPILNLLTKVFNWVLLGVGIAILIYGLKRMMTGADQGKSGSAVGDILFMLLGIGLVIGAALGPERLAAFFDLLMSSIESAGSIPIYFM